MFVCVCFCRRVCIHICSILLLFIFGERKANMLRFLLILPESVTCFLFYVLLIMLSKIVLLHFFYVLELFDRHVENKTLILKTAVARPVKVCGRRGRRTW